MTPPREAAIPIIHGEVVQGVAAVPTKTMQRATAIGTASSLNEARRPLTISRALAKPATASPKPAGCTLAGKYEKRDESAVAQR
jgi:hypothetical protein